MSKKRTAGPFSSTDLLQAFKQSKRPLGRNELFKRFKKQANRKMLDQLLDDLLAEGKVIKLKGGAYGLTESLNLVTGTLEVQRSGVGFVLPEDPKRQDIFISPDLMGEAWHGDRVAVAILSETGRRPSGRVVRVIERGRQRFSARVLRQLSTDLLLCAPTETRMNISLALDISGPAEDSELPDPGDVVLVEIGERLEGDLYAATLLERLGRETDHLVQEAMVKANHQVPTSFPGSVLREAESLPALPSEEDMAGRKDLRDMPFVTIDGAKARDFDDAIFVERRGRAFKLWVAIADVSHYAHQGSAMDREARARGNSYYFPQSVEPMFPEALSNGLCSLNPNVPRLAMVVEIPFSQDGVPRKPDFHIAVIQSKARLTYAQVNRALFLGDQDERKAIKPVLPMLERAEKLARLLHVRRVERGSLDFDLPEPEILFNLNGETVDIRPKVRHFGHQLIEEFMVAANEAVARFLTENKLPCLYRAHPDPDPDKLDNLFAMLRTTELAESLPSRPTPKALQQLLAAAEDTDMEFLVNRLVLRSMMQAKYMAEHLGHFGLASECYCHFTSPIRRYADLEVHRSLKSALAPTLGLPAPKPPRGLPKLADELSVLERRAVEAEREILKRVTVLFLRDREGDSFTGVISSFMDFGFWVELNEVLAEGMIRLSSMDDDYYAFFPERQELLGQRTGRRLRLGQTIKVRIQEVNVSRLEVTLVLDELPLARRKPGRPRPQKSNGQSKAKRSQTISGTDDKRGKRSSKSGSSKTTNGAAPTSGKPKPKRRPRRKKGSGEVKTPGSGGKSRDEA